MVAQVLSASPAAPPTVAAVALADDVYDLLRRMDPARRQGEVLSSLLTELDDIQHRLERAERGLNGDDIELESCLGAIGTALQLPGVADARAVEGMRRAALPTYEELASCLIARGHRIRRLRPTNYARNVFHVLGGTTAMLLVEMVLPLDWMVPVALGAAAWAWSLELSRRAFPPINDVLMRFFGSVAHPHEANRVNSSTWFSTAVVMLALLGSVPATAVALAVLGWADPAAALVGRRFGRHPLINGRTLEGTLAFMAVGTIVGMVVLSVFHGELSMGLRVAMALGAAVPAAIAELVARRIDDNLAIPLTAAAGLLCAAAVLG